MRLGDVEVWIACDGDAPLPEFQAALEPDGQTMACYVPSEAGKVGAPPTAPGPSHPQCGGRGSGPPVLCSHVGSGSDAG